MTTFNKIKTLLPEHFGNEREPAEVTWMFDHMADIIKYEHPLNDAETLKGTKNSPARKGRLADNLEDDDRDYDDDVERGGVREARMLTGSKAPKLKADSIKVIRAQDKANKIKKVKKSTSTSRSLDSVKESKEKKSSLIYENNVELKDGSTVTLNASDSKMLASIYSELSSKNKSGFEKTALKNKKSLADFLKFAREAGDDD